jgi:hypothetical protein
VLKLRRIEVQTAQGKRQALVCKEAEISEQSYYRWPKEHGGLHSGASGHPPSSYLLQI